MYLIIYILLIYLISFFYIVLQCLKTNNKVLSFILKPYYVDRYANRPIHYKL